MNEHQLCVAWARNVRYSLIVNIKMSNRRQSITSSQRFISTKIKITVYLLCQTPFLSYKFRICLSFCLPLFLHLSVLTVRLSLCLSVFVCMAVRIGTYVRLPVYLPQCLSVSLFIYLSLCIYVSLSVIQSECQSVCSSIVLYIYQSISQLVSLSLFIYVPLLV